MVSGQGKTVLWAEQGLGRVIPFKGTGVLSRQLESISKEHICHAGLSSVTYWAWCSVGRNVLSPL